MDSILGDDDLGITTARDLQLTSTDPADMARIAALIKGKAKKKLFYQLCGLVLPAEIAVPSVAGLQITNTNGVTANGVIINGGKNVLGEIKNI